MLLKTQFVRAPIGPQQTRFGFGSMPLILLGSIQQEPISLAEIK